MTLIKQIHKGVQKQFVDAYGARAIQPERKEPFSSEMVRDISNPTPGATFAGRKVEPSHFWVNWEAICKVEATAGFRKEEVSGKDLTYSMSRTALVLRLGDSELNAWLDADLDSMGPGDGFYLMTPPCKNDPLGLVFGPTSIWLGMI